MADTTARFGLNRSASGDTWDRQLFLNDNWNKLDSAVDRVFTSVARPTVNIKVGMRGYETDTGRHVTCTADTPSVVWTYDDTNYATTANLTATNVRVTTLETPHAASISKNANQGIGNNTVDPVKVTFQVSDFNFGSMVDLVNNRLIVQAKGLYTLIFTERWAASAEAGSMRVARIRVNGTDIASSAGQNQNSPQGSTTLSANRTWSCLVGDIIEAYAWQNSGASADLTTNFGGTFLSAQLTRRIP